MLAYVLKSTLILVAAALAAYLLRHRSAAARHIVWTAAAAALLGLPVLSWVLPAMRVPVASNGPAAVFQVFVTGRAGDAGPAPSRPLAPPRSGAPSRIRTGTPASWSAWLPAVWAAGTAIGLLQMFAAWFVLWRLRRRALPFADADAAQALAGSLGIDSPVDVLETARGTMPMTCGIFRPAVLMPAGASDWSAERVRVVLLHELAHVRRGDVATHLLARVALSIHWWNPLAWLAWREFVKERERATDDLVLAAGERASDYAGHLLEIARSFQPEAATAWAALAMARRSELEGRLIAILDSGVNRRPAGRKAALAASLAAVVLAAPFAALQAQDAALPPELDATMRAAASQKNHELLDRAAAAYEKLGKFDVARRLLESSLVIRGQVSGESSAAYAAGLVKLAELAQQSGHPEQADALYAQAVALGDRPEVAKALLHLGVRATAARNEAVAEDFFERVLKVAPTGPQAASAMVWLAGIRERQPGRDSEAETLLQKAIGMEQPPADRAAALHRYAEFLGRQNRPVEAKEMLDRALAATRQAVGDAPVRAGVFRVGGGVTAPAILYKVEPIYTEEARAAKIAGTVLLYLEVGPDGRAYNIRVARSLEPGLDQKAIEAIRQWRFKPGTKDGAPVTVSATIEVNFRLL